MTRRDSFYADLVIFNLTSWEIVPLLGEDTPARLRHIPPMPDDGWGAFMVYIGLDEAFLSDKDALHHQVIVIEPFGEGNTLFMSISPG